MSSSKKIALKSSDGKAFEVDEAVALESQAIKHMIEDHCADDVIPLPNVTSEILAKVIEYCKKHLEALNPEDPTSEDDLKKWDAEFVKVDQSTIYDLIMAANYLNIKGLQDLTCQTVTDMIKGKNPVEISKILNLKNDFTPEEEERARLENSCAFEDSVGLKSQKTTCFVGGFIDNFLSHLTCCCCALVRPCREVEIRGVCGSKKTRTSPPVLQDVES